jgi:poly-gamma-glutamate synthesis protein (capsule biosynthesis protein)
MITLPPFFRTIIAALFAVCSAVLIGTHTTAAEQRSAHTTTVTLSAVGDILFDRGVGVQIQRHGLDYPFQHTAKALSSADITFGNLECPLSKDSIKVSKPFVFKAKPETAQCLQQAGFDIMSVANNHSLDCGRTGLLDTMQALRQRGIRWCGGGTDMAAAEAPTILTVDGIRIAFVGFCQFLPEGVFLRDDKPSIAIATTERVRRAVIAARRQANVVVASFHWGIEYESRPSPMQRILAQVAIAAGADLVLGHHPHVLQGLQRVKSAIPGRRNALIIYSLGNFVFDTPRQWDRRTAETMILRCTLSKQGVVAASVLPMTIQQCRPRATTKAEAAPILKRLTELSGELDTRLVKGRVDFTSTAISR